MSDMGEVWREERQRSQAKRLANRKSSADLLRAAGIPFTSKNGGAHLIVYNAADVIDFWPGTGKWRERGSKRSKRGVDKLIETIKKDQVQP